MKWKFKAVYCPKCDEGLYCSVGQYAEMWGELMFSLNRCEHIFHMYLKLDREIEWKSVP